ncbi:MAG: hypothetical protein V3R85_09955 [Alphaproteobacteria bacterium]
MTSAIDDHNANFRRINADLSAAKPPHDLFDTPLSGLAANLPEGHPLRAPADEFRINRTAARLTTRRTSFDIWAAMTRIEILLADERRLAPRFHVEQLVGQPSIAGGNEYRLTVTDPNRLSGIAGHGGNATPRLMDLRVSRAGPWAGETAELTIDTLINHALAGTASLWLVAHGSGPDGLIEVTLDGCELSRWGWAPDALTASDQNETPMIVDFERLADRLAGLLDAADARLMSELCFRGAGTPSSIAANPEATEALKVHPAIADLLALAAETGECQP